MLINILIYSLDQENRFMVIISLISTFLFLVKFRNDIPILILFFFICSYSFEAINFFFNGLLLTAWPDFQQSNLIYKVLLLDNIFVFCLGNSINQGITNNLMDLKELKIKNSYLFFLTVLLCIFFIFYGIKGVNLLLGGFYGRSVISTLNEYIILVVLVLILTAPSDRAVYRLFIILICTFFILKNLLYGGRIEVLQLSLMILYFYYLLPGKYKKYVIYSFLFLGIYAVSLVGKIRSNPLEFLEGNFLPYLNPLEVFSINSSDVTYLSSNQGDVIQSSARILGLIDKNFLDPLTRFGSFIFYLFSSLLPSNILPDYANLASFKQDLYRSGGGGLISVYFYTWIGFLGPFISGLFLGYSINQLYLTSNSNVKLYGFLILCTFPRWYAYNPIFIVKFCVYGIVLYSIYKLVHVNFFLRKL